MDHSADINKIIKSRRAIFPSSYNGVEIPKEVINQILELANYAPTHRLTEPWRFKIFRSEALKSLSIYLSDRYKEFTPEDQFSEIKLKKIKSKPLQSSCVIAICMQRDPKESVPEWEEIAATAMAVQNMWLGCSARGIGAYWSSPKTILDANEFLGLKDRERCLGLFYMGYIQKGLVFEAKRTPIAEKVQWF